MSEKDLNPFHEDANPFIRPTLNPDHLGIAEGIGDTARDLPTNVSEAMEPITEIGEGIADARQRRDAKKEKEGSEIRGEADAERQRGRGRSRTVLTGGRGLENEDDETGISRRTLLGG